ncbi:MAG: hypothetical protein ACRDZM_04550 [Acidimicrobiia bacterium]
MTWSSVEGSPEFEKPLIVPDGIGGALVLDEQQAEDETELVRVYRIRR